MYAVRWLVDMSWHDYQRPLKHVGGQPVFYAIHVRTCELELLIIACFPLLWTLVSWAFFQCGSTCSTAQSIPGIFFLSFTINSFIQCIVVAVDEVLHFIIIFVCMHLCKVSIIQPFNISIYKGTFQALVPVFLVHVCRMLSIQKCDSTTCLLYNSFCDQLLWVRVFDLVWTICRKHWWCSPFFI